MKSPSVCGLKETSTGKDEGYCVGCGALVWRGPDITRIDSETGEEEMNPPGIESVPFCSKCALGMHDAIHFLSDRGANREDFLKTFDEDEFRRLIKESSEEKYNKT